MTTLSYSQQQLLKVLQISPVKLTDAFATQPLLAAVSSATENQSQSAQSLSDNITSLKIESQNVAPDLSQLLAQDIAAALADGLSWQIDPDAVQSHIQQQQLLTPALATLQLAEQKKALWAQLSSYVQGSYEQS
ncbi:hypothetical protein [Rheinheimera sp. EpRS3]|uniref:hypothetical protein n=1 Tax=Rheinheimera sp. EpRS3 TaxID=1712383 RepID=UPI000748616A|nr:hypothetical protein [Rheinheimera sp. EpRS3]KUM52304.1 hypothetical protein AR688_08330 [Rheinheimera sp. EpRS3]